MIQFTNNGGSVNPDIIKANITGPLAIHQSVIRAAHTLSLGIKQVQDELRKVPAIKRAEELRQELGDRVEKNIEGGVDRVYTGLKLARLDEIKKLERKVALLNKKLRTLEKQQAA